MRHSAVSVAANIAEGSGRSSDVEFSRFLDIAYGSLTETLSHATIACDQSFLAADLRDELFSAADEIARMLSGLRTRLLSKSSN
jgi:four helix bundle protein